MGNAGALWRSLVPGHPEFTGRNCILHFEGDEIANFLGWLLFRCDAREAKDAAIARAMGVVSVELIA